MQTIREDIHENILRELIQIDSSHPLGNEMDVVRYIVSHIEELGLDYSIIDHGDNRGSLVVRMMGEERGATAFIGHIDTVAVEDAQLWKYPPFEGVIEGEHMYGRGTSDMKGGAAAMILTIKHLSENNIVPKRDTYFFFTADEEKNGMGMNAIIGSGMYEDISEIFIAEPTDMAIGIKEKGALWMSFEAVGRAAHASRPDLGINSVEGLMRFLTILKTRLPRGCDEMLGCNTAQVTVFEGGIQTNIIPSHAKAVLDIRSVSDNFDEIIRIVETAIDDVRIDFPGIDIRYVVENHRPYLEIQKDSELVKRVESVYEKLGKAAELKGINFYTDASQAVPHYNVPFVILGPGYDEMCHKRDEMMKVSQVLEAAQIYVNYVCEY